MLFVGHDPHCADTAAKPMVNLQTFFAPAQQAHPVLTKPVPAFIVMTLRSPVMGDPTQRLHRRPPVLHWQLPHQTSESRAVITAPSWPPIGRWALLPSVPAHCRVCCRCRGNELPTAPPDTRASPDTALARMVTVFCGAHHH